MNGHTLTIILLLHVITFSFTHCPTQSTELQFLPIRELQELITCHLLFQHSYTLSPFYPPVQHLFPPDETRKLRNSGYSSSLS